MSVADRLLSRPEQFVGRGSAELPSLGASLWERRRGTLGREQWEGGGWSLVRQRGLGDGGRFVPLAGRAVAGAGMWGRFGG